MRTACTALIVLAAGACPAMDNAFSIAVGPTMFIDRDSRRLTDGDDGYRVQDDHGLKGVIGFSAPERALFGYPWVDFDWTRTKAEGNRIDSFGIYYLERVPLGQALYLGAGIGSVYENIRLQTPLAIRRDDEWTVGAKVVAGLGIWGPIYVEASYQYTLGTTLGVDTDVYGLVAGLRY